jgi:hypothetical protein
MTVLCSCRAYMVDPEMCNYVREGVPLCSVFTCMKVKEHREQGLHYPGDDPGDEDRMPNEIYARR